VKTLLVRMWKEDEGVLSFEWILLVTLLTIGIVGGIAAARDAIIDEFADVAKAMIALDQSYFIADPLSITIHVDDVSGNAANSRYQDGFAFVECDRTDAFAEQQPTVTDNNFTGSGTGN